MVTETEDAVPNPLLRALRLAQGESQQQVAEALNALAAREQDLGGAQPVRTTVRGSATGNEISRWERGIVQPGLVNQRLLADHFDVPITDLGVEILTEHGPEPHQTFTDSANGSPHSLNAERQVSGQVQRSQQEWQRVRAALNHWRVPLAHSVARLYPAERRVGTTGLIARPEWILPHPIDLSSIHEILDSSARPPAVNGTGPETSDVRPLADDVDQFQTYSRAIRDLDRPRLFENRTGGRITGANLTDAQPHITFAHTTYFDTIDVSEAIAYESALATIDRTHQKLLRPNWRRMKFRRLIDDPLELAKRPALASTNTLTIIKDTHGASLILHDRNSANVATMGNAYSVMPAGVFQPPSVRVDNHANDFSLWKNIMREFSEEFLGNVEHDGNGPDSDYSRHPFRELESARTQELPKVYFLGVGVDALTIWGEILTVAVFDAATFKELFASMVSRNDEGIVLKAGHKHPTAMIPFTEHMVRELVDSDRMAPGAAALVHLAWDHRREIL